MSGSDSPPGLSRQASSRGDTAFLEACIEILSEEAGAKALLHYVRKYERAGNDVDELAEKLQAILEECEVADIKSFLTDQDGVDELMTNLASADEEVKAKFFKKLNAEVNFLNHVTFEYK